MKEKNTSQSEHYENNVNETKTKVNPRDTPIKTVSKQFGGIHRWFWSMTAARRKNSSKMMMKNNQMQREYKTRKWGLHSTMAKTREKVVDAVT